MRAISPTIIGTLLISVIAIKAFGADDPSFAAYKLYQQGSFTQAADKFEGVIQTTRPNAEVYYYAALANRRAQREQRALQLFAYIEKNFPGTPEATFAKTVFATTTPVSAPATATTTKPAIATLDLPEAVKAKLSPDMLAMLKTPAGQEAIKAALQQQQQQTECPPVSKPSAPTKQKGNDWDQYAQYVEVRDHDFYTDEAKSKLAEAISLLPEEPRQRVLNTGCHVILLSTNKDFDGDLGFDAAGMYIGKTNMIEMSEKDGLYVKKHYKCILFHEWGHAFDNGTSKSEAYLSLFNEELAKLSTTDLHTLDYYVNPQRGPREAFAQFFAIACADAAKVEDESPRDGRLLRLRFPKTLAYVRSVMNLP